MEVSATGCAGCAGSGPGIYCRTVPPADVEKAASSTTPNDHLTACPHGCMGKSAAGRARCIGSCPRVHRWVVSPTCADEIGKTLSSPNNHLGARPDRCVTTSRAGADCEASARPYVGCWIVATTGVQIAGRVIRSISTPNNHFAPSPHCCVTISPARMIDRASCRPGICRWVVAPPSI